MNELSFESHSFHSIPRLTIPKRVQIDSPSKKLLIHPHTNQHRTSAQNRSLSANGKFRIIFQVPRRQHKISINKKSGLSPIDYKKYSEFKYLNEINNLLNKENLFGRKTEKHEKSYKENSFDLNRIKAKAQVGRMDTRLSPSKVNLDESYNLVTFRPECTPTKSKFRFPREVFAIDTRRKLGVKGFNVNNL